MGERSQDPIGQSFLRMYAINKSMAEYLEKKVPEEENIFKESEKEMMMDENTLDERSLVRFPIYFNWSVPQALFSIKMRCILTLMKMQ